MTPEMRDALLDLRQPTGEPPIVDDAIDHVARAAIARQRARLEQLGLLGLVTEVAIAHEVLLDELLVAGSFRKATAARRAAWARIRAERMWSYERIARVFETTTKTVTKGIHDHEAKEAASARAA